jgi:hypothetical protein
MGRDMRIEINLTEEVAKAIQEKAEAQNHSRVGATKITFIPSSILGGATFLIFQLFISITN